MTIAAPADVEPSTTAPPILRVEGLTREFHTKKGVVKAATDVTFDVARGETLALVGESGCGKSTTARMILGLLRPTSGSVILDGKPLPPVLGGKRDRSRRELHAVFQDSFSSLDPRMRIAQSLAEPLRGAGIGTKESAPRVAELLDLVGLDSSFAKRYPHQMSGGQRQRIGIARALARHPSLLVMDEPVSALDLSVQAQIVALLLELKASLGVATVFISHDLGVVRHISDRVAIMYLGRIVESGPTAEVFANPSHPYTKALLGAALPADPAIARTRKPVLEGELPSPMNIPSGCPFHQRCPVARPDCAEREPVLESREAERLVACHYPNS